MKRYRLYRRMQFPAYPGVPFQTDGGDTGCISRCSRGEEERRRRRVCRIFHSVGDFFHPRFLVSPLRNWRDLLLFSRDYFVHCLSLPRISSIHPLHILKAAAAFCCIMHCIYFEVWSSMFWVWGTEMVNFVPYFGRIIIIVELHR